MVSIIAKD